MANQKKNRAVPMLTMLSAVCSLIGLFLYCQYGTNKLCPELLMPCIAAMIVSALLGIVLAAVSFAGKHALLLRYVLHLSSMTALAEYIVSQLNYIANVIYGVDGNSFSLVMMLTLSVLLAGWLAALLAAVIQRRAMKYGPADMEV